MNTVSVYNDVRVVKRKVRLRPWVKIFVGSLLVSFILASVLMLTHREVVYDYKEVFIGQGGSAYGAIDKLNSDKGVDLRDIVDQFERVNHVSNAGHIQQGVYLVPVVKEVK